MDGLTEKEQKRQYHREWRQKNREKVKAAQDRYYAANAEKQRAKSAKWRAENPCALKEYVKASYAKNKKYENARAAIYHAANKEVIAARKAAYRIVNGDSLRAAHAKWRNENPGLASKLTAIWAKNNPDKVCAISAKRRAAKIKATPSWARDFLISEAYDIAALRTKATGIEWHVDHIVPLRSSVVCGLHCEFNIRVITAKENVIKGNRHWPDMP